MTQQKTISGNKGGKGGGGGSARVAVEAPNTLQSRSTAQIIDLISEGEIVGLVNGKRSIYFNDTPLENDSGTDNFTGITVDERNGTPTQDHIQGFDAVEREVAVGLELTKTDAQDNHTFLTQTISDSDVDVIRIKVRVPQLTNQNISNGDLNGSSVSFDIYVKPNNGTFTKAANSPFTISGKTTSPYERSYRIPLPAGGAPWEIKLERTTADSDKVHIQNKTFWSSYTELIEEKLTYPDSALVGISINAQQFGSSIPSRAYEVKGLIINVPTNYDPTTRVYTGIWDGTFKLTWSDNPAWVLYDLLTNKRYGLGDTLTENQVDKWSLYTIAQYCDELVPDGFGGEEPRMSFNAVIHSQQEAYDVVNAIASAFRGMLYWGAGTVVATQDSPSDPIKLVSSANVIDGQFNYEGAALKARHSAALVTWNDPADAYRPAIVVVEDPVMIQRYGWKQADVVAYGATSKGQAVRFGKWLLDSEQNETETVTYRAALDHADVRPGDIISIADPAYAGIRFGGRIKSIGGNPEQGLTLTKSFIASGNIANSNFLRTANVVFACDITFPATPSGVIFEVGDSTTGLYVGANTTQLIFRAGDGATPTTDNMARLAIPVSEVADETGTLVVEVNMAAKTIRAWFKNVQLGTAIAKEGFEGAIWAGTDNGGYGSTSTGIVTGETSSAFNGTLDSSLRYYENQTVSNFPTQLILDNSVTLEANEDYTLSVVLPDGSVEDKVVTTQASTTAIIDLQNALSATPISGSMWVLTASNITPRRFRVIAVTEQDKNIFEVTALLHDPTKYARVEENFILENPPSFSNLPSGSIEPPSNISTLESLYEAGPAVKSSVTLSWSPPSDPRVSSYDIEMITPEQSLYLPVATTNDVSYEIKDINDGFHQFRVRSISSLGQTSDWMEYSETLIALSEPPADVKNFEIQVTDTTAKLSWSKNKTDPDFDHYIIKFSSDVQNASWESSFTLADDIIDTFHSTTAMIGSYLIKAVDQTNNASKNAAVVSSNVAVIQNMNVVSNLDEAPLFTGNKETVIYDSTLSGIRLDANGSVLTWNDVLEVNNFFAGESGYSTSGEYAFANSIDLGATYTSRITANMVTTGTDLNNNFLIESDILSLANVFGAEAGEYSIRLQMRTTDDDPAANPTWSSWKNFQTGRDHTARAFEWQMLMSSIRSGITPVVNALSVQVDMPERIVSEKNLICPDTGSSIMFSPAFRETPAIAPVGQNMATGDYYSITNQSETGFDIQFFNSSSAGISRTFDYIANGYGVKQ